MPEIECPQCGHRALSVATRCPRCGNEFPPDLIQPLPSTADRHWVRWSLMGAGALVLIIAIGRFGRYESASGKPASRRRGGYDSVATPLSRSAPPTHRSRAAPAPGPATTKADTGAAAPATTCTAPGRPAADSAGHPTHRRPAAALRDRIRQRAPEPQPHGDHRRGAEAGRRGAGGFAAARLVPDREGRPDAGLRRSEVPGYVASLNAAPADGPRPSRRGAPGVGVRGEPVALAGRDPRSPATSSACRLPIC